MLCCVEQPKGLGRHFALSTVVQTINLSSRFCEKKSLKKSAGVTLRDVQGNSLSHHGTRHVKNIDFQIADISDNILSLGKLLRNGFVFN